MAVFLLLNIFYRIGLKTKEEKAILRKRAKERRRN